MDLSNPIGSVIPSSYGPVLEVLARTDAPLSGRSVASLTGGRVSQRQVSNTLRALVENGVVLCESHPPANLYRLNRDHVAAEPIAALASMRDGLIERMRTSLAGWDPVPDGVWLFGSVARGEGDSSSDIDVLVLRPSAVDSEDPDWVAQLESFSGRVRAWSGNSCIVVEYATGEFEALSAAGERLPLDVARDGILLAGDRDRSRGIGS